MGRESCDPTIIHSSIALLQERFRRLEKEKASRQQRELLRLFSGAEHVKAAAGCEPSRLFFHSELIPSSRRPPEGSLYFHTNTQGKHSDRQVNETPNLANLWSKDTVINLTNNSDESDVDTSLHL